MSATTKMGGPTLRVMGLIGAGHGLSHSYTLVLPPLFPLLKAHFGVSYAALGLVISLLNLATAVAQVPAGVLVDRFGARRLLILGMAASSIGVIGAALADNYWVLVAAMAVSGFCNGVIRPARDLIVCAAIPKNAIGRVFGLVSTGGWIGMAATPVMFGYALDVGRPDLVFWLSGAFMAAAIVTVVTITRPRAA